MAPDGDIKFEIGEMDDQMMQIQGTQVQQQPSQTTGRKRKQTLNQVQQPTQQTVTATRVTKCKHCNGSGVVILNSNGQSSQVEVQLQKPQQMQQLVQIQQHSPQQTHVVQQTSPVPQQVVHIQQAQPVQQQQTVAVQQHSQPPATQTQ